jgi:fatty-acyl-CoA synthase
MAEGVGWPKPARKKREDFPETSLMPTESIQAAASAYAYPLLIKQLLHTPLATAADQEIVPRQPPPDLPRPGRRIRRLANALRDAGVGPGDTVAVMDWDSHRYLECFFAVPMMGAVLQTVNVRLSPEQILYTLNHAGADIVLVNADFIPVLAGIKGQLETVKRFVLISDTGSDMAMGRFPLSASTRPCWRRRRASTTSRLRREHAGHDLLHDRHDRAAEGRLFQPPPLVLHTLAVATALGTAGPGPPAPRRRVHADHPDVPRPRLGHALRGDHARPQAGLSRPLCAGDAASSTTKRSPSRTACRPSCTCC